MLGRSCSVSQCRTNSKQKLECLIYLWSFWRKTRTLYLFFCNFFSLVVFSFLWKFLLYVLIILHAVLFVFRFSQLKSLNLSHNRLGVFPECVCEILTLTELNLSCNSLHTVPVQIGNLQRCSTGYSDTHTIHVHTINTLHAVHKLILALRCNVCISLCTYVKCAWTYRTHKIQLVLELGEVEK